jgi:hypothetical protein
MLRFETAADTFDQAPPRSLSSKTSNSEPATNLLLEEVKGFLHKNWPTNGQSPGLLLFY